jgi:hypothetical protein
MKMLRSKQLLRSPSLSTSLRGREKIAKPLLKVRWSTAKRTQKKKFGNPKLLSMKNKYSKKNHPRDRKTMFLRSIIMAIMLVIRKRSLDTRLKMTNKMEKSHIMMIRKIQRTY